MKFCTMNYVMLDDHSVFVQKVFNKCLLFKYCCVIRNINRRYFLNFVDCTDILHFVTNSWIEKIQNIDNIKLGVTGPGS